MRRKWVYGLLLLPLITAVTVMTLPVWFPWVLAPLAARFGVVYSSYQRDGMGHLVLRGVQYHDGAVDGRADRVQTLLPGVWLWKLGPGRKRDEFVRIQGWELIVSRGRQSRSGPAAALASSTNASLSQVLEQVHSAVTALNQWLPRAELLDGRMTVFSNRVDIPIAAWISGVLTGRVESPALGTTATIQAELHSAGPWRLEIESVPWQAGLNATVKRNGRTVELDGVLRWQTNRMSWAAALSDSGWWPVMARASAEHFVVSAKSLNLEGYQDLTGSFAGQWKDGHFDCELSGNAEPLPARRNQLFPAVLALRARGDTNQVRIDEATVRTPWLQASVSPGATIDYEGRLTSPDTRLELTADLSKQPWFRARGILAGRCTAHAGTDRFPKLQFQIEGADCEMTGVKASKLELGGRVDWPNVVLERCEVQFAEGGRAALIASANLQTRTIANGVVHLEGKFGGAAQIPSLAYRDLTVHINLHGPLDQLAHAGAAEVHELTQDRLAALDVQVSWQGKGMDLDGFDGVIAAGDSRLHFRGSAKAEQGRAGLTFEELALHRAGEMVYALARPFTASLDRDEAHEQGRQWLLDLQPLEWRGHGRNLDLALDLAWPLRGQFQAAAQNFDTSEFQGFFKQAPPSFAIDELRAGGGWTNGPVEFGLSLATHVSSKVPIPLAIRVQAKGNADGLSVNDLQVTSGAAVVIQGNGSFPMRLEPNGRPVLKIDQDRALQLHAVTAADPAFWEGVSEWVKVRLSDPVVEVTLAGPVQNPAGTIRARLAGIGLDRWLTNRELPRIENIRADLEINRAEVRLRQLQAQVEGQLLSASAALPLSADWSADWHRFFRWENASGAVQVANAQLAPLARFVPTVLAPQGVLNADVQIRPDFQWAGLLTVSNVATRPLASLGAVDQLKTQVRLAGRRIEVQTFTGTLGGESFGASGAVDLDTRHPATGLPQLTLKVRGRSLPLVRQPGMILRSDADLTIASATNGQARISGNVKLRDSVLLSDLRSLVPNQAAKPRERPPYFSIDTPPFADWGLDLHVSGDKFLKVRSPFFRGLISADLKLEGTLREPIALGEVNVNSGVVQFPFSNLDVTQGLVSLTSADPYHPRLFVTAGAKALGFDVKMEVTGKADNPVLQFTSTPPMSSEQVLLMLTVGELPKQGTALSTQQRASRLALFLGKSLLSEFSSDQGGLDRLTIRSGEYLSQQGQQTYSLEYRLNDRWSIEGEYDRFGDFNADLKWRLFSR